MSVYDLGEEEQLTLALQRSMGEESSTNNNHSDPELTGGEPGRSARQHRPRPVASSVATAMAAAGQGTTARVAIQGLPATGGDGGGGPQPSAAQLQGSMSEPEVVARQPNAGFPYTAAAPGPMEGSAGSVADDAAGGSRRGGSGIGVPPSPAVGTAASARSTRDVFLRSPYAAPLGSGSGPGGHGLVGANSGGSLPPPSVEPAGRTDLDAEVKRALELARQQLFDEAEAVLANFCARQPEHRERRELQAAREAVALCKQFHTPRPA